MHDESVVRQNIASRLRRGAARMRLNYPTDPLNLGLCLAGSAIFIAVFIAEARWEMLASGLVTLAIGLLGIYISRSRFLIHSLHVAVIGATTAWIINLLAFAPFPIWWLILLPGGAAITGAVLYYWSVQLGLLWYVLEAAAVALSISVVTGSASNELAGSTEVFLAGEIGLLAMTFVVVLFMPEQADTQAYATSVTHERNQLANLAQQISATADGLGRASSAIHTVTGQQGSGAEQQASVITEAVTMLNEFISLADQIRNQARSITELSEQTTEVSERGQNAIRRTAEGMAKIRSQVTLIALNITGLAEQMQRIDEIIASVSEIATQSNLLALNASIEAARAGHHGRGFAVVADEVRTLAQQSKDAAAQVQSILGEIQEAMKQTVRATEAGDQQVDEGMNLSEQAGDVIMHLADNVNESASAMRSIMIAIDQQSTGLEEITRSMRNIHDVTQENLESTKTAEIVAENLSRLSEELLAAIARHTGDATDLHM
jgi:methyl-accepting chemotaxis protein